MHMSTYVHVHDMHMHMHMSHVHVHFADSPVLTHSHSPRSASCSKSGRTRTKTRARAVELCSSAGPVDATTRVRQEATPLLYNFPLAMRRSLVSLDSPAPEAGAGATGPDSLAPFKLGNASSRLPCAGKAFSCMALVGWLGV